MQQNHLHTPATFAATACGIAFAALIIIFPIILSEIAQMEEELALHRGQYQTMSDTIWQYLMEENQQLRLTRAVRRNRSQYDGVGEENGYGKGVAENGGVKGENGCPRGPPGPPGEPGEKGVNGLDGLPGKDGVPGIAAVPYAIPEKSPCAPCPPGRPGLRGYKGKRGPRGPIGEKGEAGMPGRDGTVGEEGPEGDIGPVGPQGLPGEKGLPGLDGYQYIRGPPGEKGEPGPQGPEGDQGPPGERGDQGEQGLPGEPGRPGPPGPEGLMGNPGPDGQPGSVGADAEYCPCPARDGKGYGAGYEQTEKPPASKIVESTSGLADVYQKIKPEGKSDKVTGITKKPSGIRTKNGRKEKPLGNGYAATIGKLDEAQTAQPYKKAVFA